MAAQGHNQGFHVLDEFVCDAIHGPSVPLADPANQGRNEGMAVVEELLFEARTASPSGDPDARASPGTVVTEEALKSEAQRLAAMIAGSADPLGTATQFQKLLFAELTSIQKTALARENGRGDGQRPEPGGE